jgi:hypothetical protein
LFYNKRKPLIPDRVTVLLLGQLEPLIIAVWQGNIPQLPWIHQESPISVTAVSGITFSSMPLMLQASG